MVRVSTRIISSSCQESVLFDERYHCFYLMMKYMGEVKKNNTIFADETAIFIRNELWKQRQASSSGDGI